MNYDGQYAQWQRATEEALDAALAACGAPEPLRAPCATASWPAANAAPRAAAGRRDAAGGAWQRRCPWAARWK